MDTIFDDPLFDQQETRLQELNPRPTYDKLRRPTILSEDRPQTYDIIEEFLGQHVSVFEQQRENLLNLMACPFLSGEEGAMPCRKDVQSQGSVCSIRYRDLTYPICDHRLKGDPIKETASRYFGIPSDDLVFKAEIQPVAKGPIFDFVIYPRGYEKNYIVLESQAFNIVNGLRPQREAFLQGEPPPVKGSRANPNKCNSKAYLDRQLTGKASWTSSVKVPLIVVCMSAMVDYIQHKSRTTWHTESKANWDIMFQPLDFGKRLDSRGVYPLILGDPYYFSYGDYMRLLQTNPWPRLTRDGLSELAREKPGNDYKRLPLFEAGFFEM